MAPGALLDTRRPLVTCCPPSCSATSFGLGLLQATRLRAKHSAPFRQPIQCPPGHSASSWPPCALLAVRPPPCCSMYWSLHVILAAKRYCPPDSTRSWPLDALKAVWSPWLLGSFLILRCLLATQTILALIELQEGTKWSGGCRASCKTSNSREDLEWSVECQAARRTPISLERAKWPVGA